MPRAWPVQVSLHSKFYRQRSCQISEGQPGLPLGLASLNHPILPMWLPDRMHRWLPACRLQEGRRPIQCDEHVRLHIRAGASPAVLWQKEQGRWRGSVQNSAILQSGRGQSHYNRIHMVEREGRLTTEREGLDDWSGLHEWHARILSWVPDISWWREPSRSDLLTASKGWAQGPQILVILTWRGWHLVERQSPIYRNHGANHTLFPSALEPRIPHTLQSLPGPELRPAEYQPPALAYLHLLRALPLGLPGSLPASRGHFQELAAAQGPRA